jgi:flagellar biosynthesis protein FlhF
MRYVAIVAENPQAAVTQVHDQLGPDAVIVSVRKMRPEGMAWLWPGNRKIEVTACVPEKAPEIKREEIKREVVPFRSEDTSALPRNRLMPERSIPKAQEGRWRSIAWLESNGLLPAFSRQLEEKVNLLYGQKPLPAMQTEWTAITDLIICHWVPARQETAGTGRPHVFIGPAGSGKTTALCKWMASAILSHEQRVRVWRLDGESANSAELLTLHCELTGVPVERFWNEPDESADFQFVDLPGVEMDNPNAMSVLRDQLSLLPQPHVHLVLNAAYEISILLEQFRAFESFGPEDIIFTHMDEEFRRVKLWNFVLGTKCPISFLCAGQKIPGEFQRAEPALLFPQGKRH